MKSYDVMQMAVVIIAVLLSALYMLGRVAPRWRGDLAAYLQQARYPRWLNVVGTWLMPGGGCGSGCSSCDSCPSNGAKK